MSFVPMNRVKVHVSPLSRCFKHNENATTEARDLHWVALTSLPNAMGDRRICFNHGRLEDLEEDFCSNEAKPQVVPENLSMMFRVGGF